VSGSRLERVADHPYFRKAPVLRDLLVYLWRHQDREISEYELATEVLGRPQDFDPKTDSTVRVQIGRLRQRLKDYSSQPDADATIVLEIPLGVYRLQIHEREAPPPPAKPVPWLTLGLATLCVAFAWLAFAPRKDAKPALNAFWKNFLHESKPVQIVVPAPVFFRWENEGFVARDFSVNDPTKLAESSRLRYLTEKLGQPVLSQLYTVASDTIAAAMLSRHLEEHGVAVKVFDTPSLSLDSLTNQDAILLAGPGTTDQAKAYLPEPGFVLEQGTGRLINRQPRPGEASEWRDVTLAPNRVNGHGVLAVYPGRAPGTRLLMLASRYNIALAGFLINDPSAIPSGNFEAVLAYERNGDRILSVKPVLVRR
jgi:hypothetical protein